MTTISEIARAADVSVDSVLRVLNRDKVSEDVAARVIAVMDAYGYGRLPRPEPDVQPDNTTSQRAPTAKRRAVTGEVVEERTDWEAGSADAVHRAREQLLNAVGDVVDELENPQSGRRGPDIHLPERSRKTDAMLERLTSEVAGMRLELERARGERLEDLTLLVDLVTTSWRAVDRRLGRIERKLERMEGFPEALGRRDQGLSRSPRV